MKTRTFFGLMAVGGALSLAPGSTEMWNCSVGDTSVNTVVLVSMGASSYVKLSGQRVPATVTVTGKVRRWVWGGNSIAVDDEGLAQYYEGGDTVTPKASLRCRRMR